MGIEGFFGNFILTKKRKDSVIEKLTKKVTTLAFDANGIFHKAAQKVYGYGRKVFADELKKIKNSTSEELKQQFLDEILASLNRNISFFKPTENIIIAVDGVANCAKISQQKSRRYLSSLSKNERFDSNCITPGTDIMFEIDDAISKWLRDNRQLFNAKRIIYSSHMSPGEGEHKIFDFFRTQSILPSEGANVIYGMDSDLIMLSLISKIENIYLCREKHDSYIDIDKLRRIIESDDISIQDFVVLANLVGNDFLPKPPSFTNPEFMLEKCISLYNQLDTDICDKDGNIDWFAMLSFFEKYSEIEKELFVYVKNEKMKYPYLEIEESFDKNEFNMDKFRELWYNKLSIPYKEDDKLIELPVEDKDKHRMGRNYMYTFQWILYYYTKGPEKVNSNFFYPFKYAPLTKEIITACRLFTKKTKELRDYVLYQPERDLEITAIHQLIMVMPPSSIYLIPAEYRKVYESMSWAAPKKFTVPLEGVNEDWQAKPKIPGISIDIVWSEMLKLGVHVKKKYKNVNAIVLDKLNKRTYTEHKKPDKSVKEKAPFLYEVNTSIVLM